MKSLKFSRQCTGVNAGLKWAKGTVARDVFYGLIKPILDREDLKFGCSLIIRDMLSFDTFSPFSVFLIYAERNLV